MTRKDYVAIADALLSARNDAKSADQVAGIALAQGYVADALARDNGRFDRDRFARAAEGRK